MKVERFNDGTLFVSEKDIYVTIFDDFVGVYNKRTDGLLGKAIDADEVRHFLRKRCGLGEDEAARKTKAWESNRNG